MNEGGSYVVELQSYQGPLDLLLGLIEKRQLDIADVDLGLVTHDYLISIEGAEVAADQLNDFLKIAAQLILIKSNQILPHHQEIIEDESETSANLTEQLKRYKIYRDYAGLLAKQMDAPSFCRDQQKNTQKKSPNKINLAQLQSAYKKIHDLENRRASIRKKTKIHLYALPIVQKLAELTHTFEHNTQQKIATILRSNTSNRDKIASFLAVLELINRGNVELSSEKGTLQWVS